MRFLARVVSPKATLITSRDQRNRAIVDYALCLGLPIFVMATHIVYQPVRYGIAKTLGCQVVGVITWPTFILWLIWSPLLALIAAVYGGGSAALRVISGDAISISLLEFPQSTCCIGLLNTGVTSPSSSLHPIPHSPRPASCVWASCQGPISSSPFPCRRISWSRKFKLEVLISHTIGTRFTGV